MHISKIILSPLFVTMRLILLINIHKIVVKTSYYFTHNVTSMVLHVIFCLCEIIKLLILCFFPLFSLISNRTDAKVGNFKKKLRIFVKLIFQSIIVALSGLSCISNVNDVNIGFLSTKTEGFCFC